MRNPMWDAAGRAALCVACVLSAVRIEAQEPPAAAPMPAAPAPAERVDVLQLPIGDPTRAGRAAPVVLDAITDTASGELISPAELVRRMADTRVLLLGEEHTNGEFHRVQLAVIQALHAAGRRVVIGLEMFPCTVTQPLTRWTRGIYTEAQFLEESGWYETWSHHWGYYRDIFQYARARQIDLVGVNAPSAVVRAVRTGGFESLSAAQRRCLPDGLDLGSEEHRRLVRSYFSDDDPLHSALPPEQLEGLYRAQVTWDAALGWNAERALAAIPRVAGKPDPAAIVIVLLGSGHVAYGLGAERQLRPRFEGRISSLIPVVVRDAQGDPVREVKASYANYLWGVPSVPQPTLPSLGVSLMGRIGKRPLQVIDVSKDSVAEAAEVKVMDVLLALDGETLDSPTTLNRLMGRYAWGDIARLEVERAGQKHTLEVAFRRKD